MCSSRSTPRSWEARRRSLLETRARVARRPDRGKPTVNFPGEAPRAEVLDALPAAPPPPPSADVIQLRRELQQLRRENKRLKTTARGGNWTVTSTYYTGGNGTVASRQSRRSSRAARLA